MVKWYNQGHRQQLLWKINTARSSQATDLNLVGQTLCNMIVLRSVFRETAERRDVDHYNSKKKKQEHTYHLQLYDVNSFAGSSSVCCSTSAVIFTVISFNLSWCSASHHHNNMIHLMHRHAMGWHSFELHGEKSCSEAKWRMFIYVTSIDISVSKDIPVVQIQSEISSVFVEFIAIATRRFKMKHSLANTTVLCTI